MVGGVASRSGRAAKAALDGRCQARGWRPTFADHPGRHSARSEGTDAALLSACERTANAGGVYGRWRAAL